MRSIHLVTYKNFLKRLCKARERSGFTQVEVADKLGKPQSFVSKCEQGERTVDIIDLLNYSKVYGVSLDFFFEEVELENENL